jgi:hypothetical protein
MNPNIIRGEIHDAVANLSYGHRTAVIVLASIVNDLSYKVGIATLPKPEKQTTGEDTKFDESVATFFKMDGDTGRKTVPFDDLVMGFAAAQFLLIDTMNKPDPEAFGRNHADWAKKYLRTPSMIAESLPQDLIAASFCSTFAWSAASSGSPEDQTVARRKKARKVGFIGVSYGSTHRT